MRTSTFLGLMAALCLAGCVGVSYDEMHVDSAAPEPALRTRCQGQLAEGATCTARVEAKLWSTSTGIHVAGAGERYCVSVLPNQVWFDSNRRRIPPLGETGNVWMRMAELRHPEAGYFALMVDVPSVQGFEVSHTARAVTPPSASECFVYDTHSAGQLVLYPNDALGPARAPDWYYTSNNHGFIWVRIRRCEAASPANGRREGPCKI